MNKMKVKILIILYLSSLNLLFSQAKFENYQFRSIVEASSKRAITAIIKDKSEFIWIGTDGSGLFRYDGLNYIRFQTDYTEETGINSDFIHSLLVDINNRLWVGTREGLCHYDRDFDTFRKVDINRGQPVTVRSIIEDNNGNLLLGTNNLGLFKLNPENLESTQIAPELLLRSDFQVSSFSKTSTGFIYIGSNYGLYGLNNEYQTTQIFKDKFNKLPISASIECMLIDQRGFLWVGTTTQGLMRVKPDNDNYKFDVFPITENKVLSIINTKPNFIICGTENDGLIILNETGQVHKKYLHSKYNENSLKSNSIWSLYEDDEHRIWLGYYNKGLGVFKNPSSRFNAVEALPNIENSLQTSTVTSVVKDQSGKILMSSEGGGIDIFNPDDKTFIHVNEQNQKFFAGLDANDIQSIFIDSRHSIWLGSWSKGIYFVRKGSTNFKNFNISNTSGLKSNRVLTFSEDSTGKVWIGTFNEGLHYYDPAKEDFFHYKSTTYAEYGSDNVYIRKLLVDSDNVLWIGTISGLFKLDLNSDSGLKIESMRKKMMKDLKNHNEIQVILSIFESNDKTIWIGTDGAGLFSFDKEANDFTNYHSFPDMNEKSVRSIITDNNENLWISGGNGLTKLDFKNNNSTNFTREDGLLSNEFSNDAAFRGNSGDLYFGNYEGMIYFDPNAVSEAEEEPQLYLLDFKLFNESVSPNENNSPLSKVISQTEHLILNHNQSVFTIEYVGIDYNDSRKNEYAYFLEGFEDDWNYVGNNTSATYTNLEPGNYAFKLKSFSRGEELNPEILSLKITVLPPWWKTYYAYSLYILLLALFLYVIASIYKNRIEAKQTVTLEREKAVQIEKLNNKKLQFFTNISHEFRTPLTLIINPLEDILRNEDQLLPSSVYTKLKTIHKSSDRLAKLINELMDFNRLKFNAVSLQVSEIEVVGFVKDIINYFLEEASIRKIHISLHTTDEKLIDWLDPKMLEKIMFNLISNAFKFTPDGGVIKVAIKKFDSDQESAKAQSQSNQIGSYTISVEDTGSGLDKKNLKKIFDRFYQVNNLNKAYYGSTGIGLEVVKEFVELNKGSISVDSVLEVGTTFTITFPIGKDLFSVEDFSVETLETDLTKERYELSSPEADRSSNIDSVKKDYTVLIVEDHAELRNYLENELKRNYKVLVAENGKKGYDLAINKLPDIVITDVIMPEMNGLELCKNIKANIKISHIPILMLSAKALVADRVEGIDSGADIYLSKPFDMDVLKSSLSQLIKSRQIIFNNFYTGIIKPGTQNTTTVDLKFIDKILVIINENISAPELNVDFLSSKVFLSRSQLYRKIKALTGGSVNEFIRNIRLQKAKQLIDEGDDNINEISYKVGFTSPSYFTKCYKAMYGHVPTQPGRAKS